MRQKSWRQTISKFIQQNKDDHKRCQIKNFHLQQKVTPKCLFSKFLIEKATKLALNLLQKKLCDIH